MSKKTKILLFLGILLFILFIGIGIFIGYHDAESGSSTSSSPPMFIYVNSWLPFFIVFIISSQPTTPVQNVVNNLVNKKLTPEKKANNIDNFISKNFKTSDSYRQMFNCYFVKSNKIEVKEKGKEKQIISVILVNEEKYEFEVIKRTKDNALKGMGQWLINDFKKVF